MSDTQIRLLVVEDVPQVAQYIRGLLNSQAQIKLLDVLSDGAKTLPAIAELRPDVVIVDALLQGRLKGMTLVEQIASSDVRVPVVVLTVPQKPVTADPSKGIADVLRMPFSGFDLVGKVSGAHKAAQERAGEGAGLLFPVFAPKGGVGKTTISFNLAVALEQAGTHTALIDASLQFGDLRTLLNVPADAPSILDLPTDRIAESDLADVLWRDPSGIDILLAPPRIEMAEMINTRDVEKILSILRRVYRAVVVDVPSAISELTLAFFDPADVIVEIVTFDSTTIHNTIMMADTFRQIGYPPTKVRYVVNRVDSSGGIDPAQLAAAIGRTPENTIVSDGRLVVQANNGGVPFVTFAPDAEISRDVVRLANDLLGARIAVASAR
jgi:pilus assembly protein CpaE